MPRDGAVVGLGGPQADRVAGLDEVSGALVSAPAAFPVFGRARRDRARFWARNGWYLPVSGSLLRLISRLMVEGWRPSAVAMPRMLAPARYWSAIATRSSSDGNRSEICTEAMIGE
jgi:hypothetical protein